MTVSIIATEDDSFGGEDSKEVGAISGPETEKAFISENGAIKGGYRLFSFGAMFTSLRKHLDSFKGIGCCL